MKKLISIILAVFMLTSFFTASVYANDDIDTVRIEFCVGDDNLLINGESVQVETPYVVGVGVTLVPLRVITEAFGAKVEWTDATQSIDLSYPDVDIRLQIGNPIAEVNGKAETLLSAPELTNSHTMVPLRFISETFGAIVSYDDATEKITVIKEKSDSGSIVEGTVTNARIGDSYYGWSMENPTNMQLDYRSFDGSYISFAVDDNNYISLYAGPLEKNFDFEKDFNERKNDFQGYTLIKADKDTSNPVKKTMHFQIKDGDSITDTRVIVSDKYYYSIQGTFSNDNAEQKDENLRIMSTFDSVFVGEDIYDYSDVKDGMRTYEAKGLNLSFDVPADYYESEWDTTENEFIFYTQDYDDYFSTVKVAVLSKSDVGSAEEIANADYTSNKRDMNEDVVTFSDDVKSVVYGELNVYEYTYKIDAVCEQSKSKDIFFELGEYVYNFNICNKLPADMLDSMCEAIMKSVKAEEINAEEVGVFMRNVPESTGTYTSEHDDITIQIPNNYTESTYGTQTTYENQKTGATISLTTDKKNKTLSALKAYSKDFESQLKDEYDAEIIQSSKEVTLSGTKCIKLAWCIEENEGRVFMELYGVPGKDRSYIFMTAYHELGYSQNARNEIAQIISSIK